MLERTTAQEETKQSACAGAVTMTSPTAAKIALFRGLFRGREDVVPRRWENSKTGKAGYAPMCRNEWVRGVCGKPQIKCGECPNQAFIPVGDNIVRSHLAWKSAGNSVDLTLGVYSMLPDETCRFLAADFDEKSWMQDVAAFRDTARTKGIPIAIERSRSSNGAHAWIFFAELPDSVEVVLGNQVYIDRLNLPSALVNCIARLAAFQNPEFYAAQAMRLPTFDKPRIISCSELFSRHVALPRGCLDDLLRLLGDAGIAAMVRDERQQGRPIETRFLGELTPEQDKVVAALLPHETGVLAATTAFGKTVIAAKMIAAWDLNTLVLVHRRQLLDQWVARLQTFLDIPPNTLGVIHGGKKKPTGNIDVALMQSLIRQGVVSDLVADYGHVVVDECHHLSAVGFEAIARGPRPNTSLVCPRR
jgi:hypothetical protein